MKLGLRTILLMLLGVLLFVSFAPLLFAHHQYARSQLMREQSRKARWIAALSAELADRPSAAKHQLSALHARDAAIETLAVFDVLGRPVVVIGHASSTLAAPTSQQTRLEADGHLNASALGTHGSAIVRIQLGAEALGTLEASRFSILYGSIAGVSCLLILYLGLTLVVLRPVDSLARAARRVSQGARRFAAPFSPARELAELALSLTRMTDALRAEEAELRAHSESLELKTSELARAQASLVRAEKQATVGRLAAGLAHEMGNPLSAIIAMQALVLGESLEPAEQREFGERILREAERIDATLRSLLQLARAGHETKGEPRAPGDVRAAAQQAIQLVQPQPRAHGVSFECQLPAPLPTVALAHEGLVQVFVNLLINAADAIATSGRVWIEAHADKDAVVITITDTGGGVPESLRSRLFEPFVSSKPPGSGTGLGLAICQATALEVGGSLELDESYRDGARFVLKLPTARK